MNKTKPYYVSHYQHSHKRRNRHYHTPSNHYQNQGNQRVSGQNFFNGNLAQNMRFGAKGHELSGFVSRKLICIDNRGNKQIATERQFFNSTRKMKRIKIADEGEGDY
jgi:hypothetical protein